MSRKTRIVLSALAVALPDGPAPTEIRLIPAGVFRAWDGRPKEVPGWFMTPEGAQRFIAWADNRANDFCIDYEHATLQANKTGSKAPAAGWWKKMEWRQDGLYATDVRWTDDAARMIQAGEKRYLSPVLGWDEKTGEVGIVRMAGLVNEPGLEGLTDLSAASLGAEFETLFSTHEEEHSVNKLLKAMLAALGLPETASEDEALSALAKLQGTIRTEALAAYVPPPDKYVSIATMTALQAELATANGALAALQAERQKEKLDGLIQDALSAGKITPAQEAWARDLGSVKLESLSAYLDTVTPAMKPGHTQTGGKAPASDALSTMKAPQGFGVDQKGMELHQAVLSYQASHSGLSYADAAAAVATGAKA